MWYDCLYNEERGKKMADKLTDKELEYFRNNYKYMWSKLDTSYYHVKKDTDKANRIKGRSLLPAYSICARCMKDDSFCPSRNTVLSIVQFYNENLSPEVDSYRFLHEDLSLNDPNRYRNTDLFDIRFVGHYWGYYPSASQNERIVGAYMRIFEADKMMKAVLVTGIRNDDELKHPALKAIFTENPPQYSGFVSYYDGRTPDNKRCYYYEGNVEVTNSSLLVIFRGVDEGRQKLVLTLNIECFPLRFKRTYYGGLAYALATNDGPFDARFFKMGLINTENGFVPMATEGISDILRLSEKGQSQSLSLTSSEDRIWYEFILGIMEKQKK